MARFTHQVKFSCKAEEVFECFRSTAQRLRLSPPDAALELVQGPPRLERGSRCKWKMRQFGVSQTIEMETTACDPSKRLVEEQRQGPLKGWVHTTNFHAVPGGTLVEDLIDFEPPGGVMGLLVNAATIKEKLTETFTWRDKQLAEILKGD